MIGILLQKVIKLQITYRVMRMIVLLAVQKQDAYVFFVFNPRLSFIGVSDPAMRLFILEELSR